VGAYLGFYFYFFSKYQGTKQTTPPHAPQKAGPVFTPSAGAAQAFYRTQVRTDTVHTGFIRTFILAGAVIPVKSTAEKPLTPHEWTLGFTASPG
jgi:hypothetical protein